MGKDQKGTLRSPEARLSFLAQCRPRIPLLCGRDDLMLKPTVAGLGGFCIIRSSPAHHLQAGDEGEGGADS